MNIGILGGGQLARMLALAGIHLNHRFRVLDPSPGACAARVAKQIRGHWEDRNALDQLMATSDVVTFEFENVPANSARYLASQRAFFPPAQALEFAQDRLCEKQLFSSLGIPAAPFQRIDSADDLSRSLAGIGIPAVLKRRTLGYDGKGQVVINSAKAAPDGWEQLGRTPCILESKIHFRREVSIIGVRGQSGEMAFYPVSENTHRDGILRYCIAHPIDPAQNEAQHYCQLILEHLQYVGVLTLELFDTEQGLVANEIAPRVHNSGHWTIEGAATSQFENHVRAILGLPLGETSARGFSAMVNFISTIPRAQEVLAIPDASFHDYGKSPRPGRKLGHATICTQNSARAIQGLTQVLRLAAEKPRTM